MENTEADKKAIEEQKLKHNNQPGRDNPEQFPTEKESLFDRFQSERNVDPIPLEDLNIEQQDEKDKDKTKNSSSSQRKYKSGF
ncbi:hypothetical protein ACFOLF_01030 [Paenibacillus sepulcri]|uniref:Uncharacterized protein n=1 Tax=Paenibacillus sepulcri TaxID=359917 RepID=A0ABS7BZA0_9BACL|nr:hypothetical protein [Paenibacillus sepulcri]